MEYELRPPQEERHDHKHRLTNSTLERDEGEGDPFDQQNDYLAKVDREMMMQNEQTDNAPQGYVSEYYQKR